MSEARIDRLLAAAVHQAIGDSMPSRLDFYESYLRPRGWREDAVNLAPVAAVLSFLRHEPEGTYDAVMTRAGEYAAGWVYDALPWRLRAFRRATPSWLRLRRLAATARLHLERSYQGTKASATARRGRIDLEVTGLIFCNTRDHLSAAHCRYYLAFLVELLRRDGVLVTESGIDGCRSSGGQVCKWHVVTGTAEAATPAPTSVEQHDAK